LNAPTTTTNALIANLSRLLPRGSTARVVEGMLRPNK